MGFYQRIMLFYNNFDQKKLKRFGKLGRKGQAGGINFFFYLLESRIDSILLRFNLCSKFKRIIYYNLKRRIRRKMFYVQPPIYFEINYRTLIILVVPKLIDPTFVSYPFFKTNSKFISGLHTILW